MKYFGGAVFLHGSVTVEICFLHKFSSPFTIEQNNSVILVSGKKILTPISFHIIINNMKWSINGIYEGIESYMYQIQLLRAIRAKQE